MIINCLNQWGAGLLCWYCEPGWLGSSARAQIVFPKVRDCVGRLYEHAPHVLGLPATVQGKCAKKLELAKKVDVDCIPEKGQCARDLYAGIL